MRRRLLHLDSRQGPLPGKDLRNGSKLSSLVGCFEHLGQFYPLLIYTQHLIALNRDGQALIQSIQQDASQPSIFENNADLDISMPDHTLVDDDDDDCSDTESRQEESITHLLQAMSDFQRCVYNICVSIYLRSYFYSTL